MSKKTKLPNAVRAEIESMILDLLRSAAESLDELTEEEREEKWGTCDPAERPAAGIWREAMERRYGDAYWKQVVPLCERAGLGGNLPKIQALFSGAAERLERRGAIERYVDSHRRAHLRFVTDKEAARRAARAAKRTQDQGAQAALIARLAELGIEASEPWSGASYVEVLDPAALLRLLEKADHDAEHCPGCDGDHL